MYFLVKKSLLFLFISSGLTTVGKLQEANVFVADFICHAWDKKAEYLV